jgi:phosphopantetheinyl transferase (holo-ACP synthase)
MLDQPPQIPFGTFVAFDESAASSYLASRSFTSLPDLSSFHENYQRDWRLSRAALLAAFEQNQIYLQPHDVMKLDFKTLRGEPEWTFTVAHSTGCSAVWLVSREKCENIGIDIEPNDREISSSVDERLRSPQDPSAISTLELWTAKEAAYKALTREQQHNLSLFDIVIRENLFTIGNEEISGQLLRFPLEKSANKFQISIAWRH